MRRGSSEKQSSSDRHWDPLKQTTNWKPGTRYDGREIWHFRSGHNQTREFLYRMRWLICDFPVSQPETEHAQKFTNSMISWPQERIMWLKHGLMERWPAHGRRRPHCDLFRKNCSLWCLLGQNVIQMQFISLCESLACEKCQCEGRSAGGTVAFIRRMHPRVQSISHSDGSDIITSTGMKKPKEAISDGTEAPQLHQRRGLSPTTRIVVSLGVAHLWTNFLLILIPVLILHFIFRPYPGRGTFWWPSILDQMGGRIKALWNGWVVNAQVTISWNWGKTVHRLRIQPTPSGVPITERSGRKVRVRHLEITRWKGADLRHEESPSLSLSRKLCLSTFRFSFWFSNIDLALSLRKTECLSWYSFGYPMTMKGDGQLSIFPRSILDRHRSKSSETVPETEFGIFLVQSR
jgi:hypothetical protein